jgi:hypothetical protein
MARCRAYLLAGQIAASPGDYPSEIENEIVSTFLRKPSLAKAPTTVQEEKEVVMKPAGLKERSVYALFGWTCGMAIGLLLYLVWRPYELFLTFPSFVGMFSALWYGESTNRIPTVDELRAPITLFPKNVSKRGRHVR